MDKELYVCDLDGTLAEDGKALKIDTIEKLNEAFSKDNKELIISSARNYKNIKERIKGLSKNLKIISRNGSVIYDERGNVVYKVNIDEQLVYEAIKSIIAHNLCPVVVKIVENSEVIYCSLSHINAEAKKHMEDVEVTYVEELLYIDLQEVIGIYAFGRVDQTYDNPNLNIIQYIDFLQISSTKANKGKALEHIKNIYGYSNITCFGNDSNDYSMLDIAENAYFVYDKQENKKMKYNNIPFDNAKSIVEIINKGGR